MVNENSYYSSSINKLKNNDLYVGSLGDVVLLINGFPIAIGEIKSPFREAISWIDGANDILAY